MPDPFSFFADPSQAALGIAPPAPIATPKPAAPAPAAPVPRSAAATMLAPAAPAAPIPAPAAQPQHPATAGNVDQFMQLVRAHESGGNDKATSGVADGRYQFTPATWAGVAREHPELGLRPNDIWDGAKQDLAMRAISSDYVNVLKMNGIAPSMPNMFMLHFLGTGGGPKFLKAMQANPNANAVAMFPLEAQYNHNDFFEKTGQPRSLQQVYAAMTKTFGGPASMASINPAETQAIQSFDKAAGVPTVPRGFVEERAAAEGLQASLTEDASALKPLPGMKLDAPKAKAELKPLPGMKFDYASKTPLTSTNPYAEGAKPKDDSKPPEVISVDPITGMPIFADEKLNKAELAAEGEVDKGFAAGVAQDVTGPASLLPNALGGGYAEKANRYLSETGDPAARTLGQLAPMAVPVGGFLGAAAKGGTEAAEALGWGAKATQAVKAAAGSAATGALAESSNPTDADTEGGRIAGKSHDMERGGLFGAVVGLVPGAASGAKWLYSEAGNLKKFISDAFGKEAKAAAEELRFGISAETGKAMTAEEQKIAHAKVEEGAARAKQAAEDARIKHLDEQQEKLRNRMQDRVKAAEAVAERAGQDAEQAKAFAAHQESAVKAAEESADKLAKDFAARPTMTQDEFGHQLQETAIKDAKELADKRRAESGFDAAVKSDGGRPSIPTKPFIAAVDEAEKRAVSDGAKATLRKLREDLRTKVEPGALPAKGVDPQKFIQVYDKLKAKQGGFNAVNISYVARELGVPVKDVHEFLKTAAKKGDANLHPSTSVNLPKDVMDAALKLEGHEEPFITTSLSDSGRANFSKPAGKAGSVNVTAVSIEKARRIVEDLDSKIDSLPPSEAHEITALKDKFIEHMEDKAPALKAARKKYAELSRPLDVYRDTGALAKSVLEDPYSHRPIVDSTKIVGALLNKTEAGADALGHVLRKGELQDSALKFFNQRLVDIAGKNPTPSEAQFANFLRDNRLALDRAGLTSKFKDLATAKATQERIAVEAKSGSDAAKRAAGEADKAAKTAAGDVDKAKALKDRAAGPSTLKAQREGPEAARKQAVDELAAAAKKQQASRDIQEHLAKLDNKLDPKVARTGPEVTAEANKTADWLKDKGYLDAAAHKELLTKIREVEQMNVDHARAAKLVKQIVIAAVVAAGPSYELGRFISHRVTP